MNIGIWGTGATASLAAWRLNSALQPPRSQIIGLDTAHDTSHHIRITIYGHYLPRIRQINKDGITMVNIEGESSIVRASATQHIPDKPEVDVALVFNKTYQLKRVARELKQSLRQNALVLCFQNGIGGTALIEREVPHAEVSPCILFEGVAINDAGTVFHNGSGLTWLGMTSGSEARHSGLVSLLSNSGFDLKIQPDIKPIQWEKLAVNAAINPLTAITGVTNKWVAEQPLLHSIAQAAAHEVSHVAKALNIPLNSNYVDRVFEVAFSTGQNSSSMLMDIRQGRETEVEFINGAIVALGKQNDIPTPVNQMLLELVLKHTGSPMTLETLGSIWHQHTIQSA